MEPAALSLCLKDRARELGFSMLGIAPAEPAPHLAAYLRWIRAGMHGTMAYLARPDRVVRREDLNVILPGARSLVIAALDYYTLRLPDEIVADPSRGRISNYAWGADYHDVMLPRLEALVGFLAAEAGRPVAARAYVDTGAILERSHAARAGLGFIGKNTMLIHPRRGSFFFLGEIITDLELTCDDPALVPMPGCGTCTRCLTACPTGAFPEPYVLDARLCISYLTIEHKGFIPRRLRPLMGNWVYGCDVCQDICPWQRFARSTWEEAFQPFDYDRAAPPLSALLTLDEEAFAQRFGGTPIYRIRRPRLVRNACIAAGNSGLPELADCLIPLLEDESPLVRGHAGWALGRLGVGRGQLAARLAVETDATVRGEIAAALEMLSAA
ncbi:MAG TPA: tRNA epoxyqueuosine(34) reductase QueG [Chloroflexi bacterium]|nr:tRNA epoxyqueuosine(34) reductase QueG [Chloroflexota bacterium]